MSSTTHHIHIPIQSFEDKLDSFKTQRQKNQYCKDMFSCTHTQAIKSITAMKSEGMTVIPSENCDKRSPEGKCLGHPHDEPENINTPNPTE